MITLLFLFCFVFLLNKYFVIFFIHIEKTMQTWRVELTAGGKNLAKTRIQRGIFQGDALPPLLFIIAMMQLSHILRRYTAGYKLSRSQEKKIT